MPLAAGCCLATITRPSKQGQIVAGALARPTALLGGYKKIPLSIPYIKQNFGVDGVVRGKF